MSANIVAGVSVTVKTTLNKFEGEITPDKEPVETVERSEQGFLIDGKWLLTPEQHDQYLRDGIIPEGAVQLPQGG